MLTLSIYSLYGTLYTQWTDDGVYVHIHIYHIQCHENGDSVNKSVYVFELIQFDGKRYL